MAFVYWIHLPEHTDMFTQGYVGFTSKTVESRFKQHNRDASKYPHVKLYRAFSKYGPTNLVVSTIVEGPNDYCLDIEFKLRPLENTGWNIQVGGGKGWLGLNHSQHTKDKLSLLHLGRVCTEAQRKNMSDASPKMWLGVNVWDHPSSRKDVWVEAVNLHNLYSEFKTCGDRRLAKASGKFDRSSMQIIIKKFKTGWNPHEDIEYLTWLNNRQGSLDVS